MVGSPTTTTAALTEKATVWVGVDNDQEILNRLHRQNWLVAVPLQVPTLPEDLPQILRAEIGGLGKRVSANDRWIVPLRANLESFDALLDQAIANIKLRTDMWRGGGV